MSEANKPELRVVASEETPTLDEPAKKSAPHKGPKWETDARDTLKTAVRRFNKPLSEMFNRDANEGDTRLLVTDFLSDGLGFDKFEDLSTEYQVRGEFADYGIRIDKDLVAFIEVKAHHHQARRQTPETGANLRTERRRRVGHPHQRRQVAGLPRNSGQPVEVDLALDVDLLGEESLTQKVNQLFYLTRASLKRRQIDELWKARRAKSPSSLAETLLSEAVIGAIRKELRRNTGHKVEDEELGRLLKETVLRPECFNK